MKIKMFNLMMTLVVVAFGLTAIQAQENNHAEHLDLYAVAELFRDASSVEKFEEALNSPSNGINNLDLNNDGAIDFIRVTEQTRDDTRLIIMQTPTGDNEYQDVATIIVERDGGDYNLQIQGDETIYGANYYVVPARRDFSAWNVVRWLFSPGYRVYVSPYRYRTYPSYYAVRRPVAVTVYRTRVGTFAGRKNFVTARAGVVRTVNKIPYRPSRPAASVGTKRVTTTTKTVTNPRNGNQHTKQTTTVTKTKRGRRN